MWGLVDWNLISMSVTHPMFQIISMHMVWSQEKKWDPGFHEAPPFSYTLVVD